MPETPLQYLKSRGHDLDAYTWRDMRKIYKSFEEELKQYEKDVKSIIAAEREKQRASPPDVSDEIITAFKKSLNHPGWKDGAGKAYILSKLEEFIAEYGSEQTAAGIIQMEQNDHYVTPAIYYTEREASKYMSVMRNFLKSMDQTGQLTADIDEFMYVDALESDEEWISDWD